MSKRQVLQQIYIREVPLLMHKIGERRRQEALDELYDQQLMLSIATATAGSCVSKESVEEIAEGLKERINQLKNSLPEQTRVDEPKQDPWEQLDELQKTIAQTRKRRRR